MLQIGFGFQVCFFFPSFNLVVVNARNPYTTTTPQPQNEFNIKSKYDIKCA